MIEALHLGSMLPAALGACCVAGGADRRSPLAWLGMLAMLAAMADTMLMPRPLLAPIVWAAALVLVALATAVQGRLRAVPPAGSPTHPSRTMTAHRSLQAVLMAGLIATAGSHHSGSAVGGAHASHGLPVLLVLGVAALAFAAASAVVALRRPLPLVPRAEAALGAAATTLMALPLLA
ncbi:hypothetical protein IT072_09350 [Leifsonia sp. ZF2019]|uniref:hypothetical protein n=1 Tax=Leifsonia sp. ZF2019 TaxID=2781978 RepID=UPI001CBB04D8|nr:hypothetical protein [Leifsonia sp. ZF2019]UAJ81162.1 hypothetical protein IT072_09350 [Leifsonia sp. ZF2019]